MPESGMQGKGRQEERIGIARVARPRNALVLAYSRRCDRFSLESGMLGNRSVPFGKGATEKVRQEPRWCPTSFGGGPTEKDWQQDLAGGLPYSGIHRLAVSDPVEAGFTAHQIDYIAT